MIEVDAPRPLAGDEVLLEVRAAGVDNWDEFVVPAAGTFSGACDECSLSIPS
jgi:hypothetical protein